MHRKQRLEFEEKQAPDTVHCLEVKPFQFIMSLLILVSLLLLLQCHGQSPITSGSHNVRCYTNAQKGIKTVFYIKAWGFFVCFVFVGFGGFSVGFFFRNEMLAFGCF